jgi:hypothetical protein
VCVSGGVLVDWGAPVEVHHGEADGEVVYDVRCTMCAERKCKLS